MMCTCPCHSEKERCEQCCNGLVKETPTLDFRLEQHEGVWEVIKDGECREGGATDEEVILWQLLERSDEAMLQSSADELGRIKRLAEAVEDWKKSSAYWKELAADWKARAIAAETNPSVTKEEAEIAVDKLFSNWMQRRPQGLYAHKTLRISGWREVAISLYRRAAGHLT